MRKKHLIWLMLLTVTLLKAQISPGDLTTAHAELEGISNCTKCHEIGEAVTNDKCLDCHKEIKNLITLNRGYHSSDTVRNENCVKCHSEHHGRGFEINRFDKNNFDHNLAGFKLIGKHASADCDKCHNEKLISDAELKKRKNTFLGMGIKCSDCHEDYHQGTLSLNCNDCHGNNSFKPTETFDHNKTAYQLTGSHSKVDCIKCHIIEKRNGKDFQVFKGLKFSSCESCHKDVHNGKLGSNCESCHSTQTFHKLVNNNRFDHTKTNFDLIGKHKNVKCESCHTSNFKRTIKYKLCIDCHKDYHKGELVKSNEVYDCKKCHNENGFAPAIYSIESHNKSSYSLLGSHLAVPCFACHKKGEDWKFKLEFNTCVGCHDNIHVGTMSVKFLNDNSCTSCHSAESWDKTLFDHSLTKFTLLGKHSSTQCYECHNINKSESVSKFVFKDLSPECESCHLDPHFNQFNNNGRTICSDCHSFTNWQPEKFRHEKTKFVLEGAHAKVNCEKCHTRKKVATGIFVKYKFKSIECAECHVSRPEEELIPKGDI